MKLAPVVFGLSLIAAVGGSVYLVGLMTGKQPMPSSAAVPTVERVPFKEDFGAALDRAEKEGKPVMLYASSDSCGYCRQLESEVFSDARFVERARGFIPVKINGNKYPALMERLSVMGYPYVGFFDSKGRVFKEIRGYAPIDGFLSEMPYPPPAEEKTKAPAETEGRSAA